MCHELGPTLLGESRNKFLKCFLKLFILGLILMMHLFTLCRGSLRLLQSPVINSQVFWSERAFPKCYHQPDHGGSTITVFQPTSILQWVSFLWYVSSITAHVVLHAQCHSSACMSHPMFPVKWVVWQSYYWLSSSHSIPKVPVWSGLPFDAKCSGSLVPFLDF